MSWFIAHFFFSLLSHLIECFFQYGYFFSFMHFTLDRVSSGWSEITLADMIVLCMRFFFLLDVVAATYFLWLNAVSIFTWYFIHAGVCGMCANVRQPNASVLSTLWAINVEIATKKANICCIIIWVERRATGMSSQKNEILLIRIPQNIWLKPTYSIYTTLMPAIRNIRRYIENLFEHKHKNRTGIISKDAT